MMKSELNCYSFQGAPRQLILPPTKTLFDFNLWANRTFVNLIHHVYVFNMIHDVLLGIRDFIRGIIQYCKRFRLIL
jgi:hypothetical protein